MAAIIKREDLTGNYHGSIISDVLDQASYNWLDTPNPTIAVPGSPNVWRPVQGQTQLAKDSGFYVIAQNAYRFPERPMEPLFRAMMHQQQFELPSFDVVTDRNNLRKLLTFIQGARDATFTMKFQTLGNTLLICRDETAVSETITSDIFRGFGHEFEKEYTTACIENSCSHHKIISYQLGPLRLLVRSQTDAYLADDESDGAADPISSDEPPQGFPDSRLTLQSIGQVVPHASVIEVKTRAAHKPFDIEEVASQLWFSQTRKLVWAHHSGGRFTDPSVVDVSVELDIWAMQNRHYILQLCDLLTKIRHVVKTEHKNSLSYDMEKDYLVVSKVAATPMLPAYMENQFTQQASSGYMQPRDNKNILSALATRQQ